MYTETNRQCRYTIITFAATNGAPRQHRMDVLCLNIVKLAHANKHEWLEHAQTVHWNKQIVQTVLSSPLLKKKSQLENITKKFWLQQHLHSVRDYARRKLPKVHMGVTATKHTVCMHCPLLITCSWNPHDKSTSYPEVIVGKKSDIAIVSLKDLIFHGLNTCKFSSQYLL